MFKRIFLLALCSGIFSSVVAVAYVQAYKMVVDFSEKATAIDIFACNLMFTMVLCFLYFGMTYVIKNGTIANVLFNVFLSGVSIAMVFYILELNDPKFTPGTDAELFVDFYKGFLMPMLFFPALSWLSLRPLFFKNES